MTKEQHTKALRRKFAMALEAYASAHEGQEAVCRAVESLIMDAAQKLAARDTVYEHLIATRDKTVDSLWHALENVYEH